MLTGSIIADPNELEAYKEALASLGIETTAVRGIPSVHGEQNYRYELIISYRDVSQVFHAGQLVKTMQAALLLANHHSL